MYGHALSATPNNLTILVPLKVIYYNYFKKTQYRDKKCL